MVKKTCFTGIRLFGELHRDTSQRCLVLDLLNEPPERNVLEVLLLRLPHLDFLLPAIVLSDDKSPDPMLDTQVDDELAGMVEVVFNLEVPFPAGSFVRTFVVQPVDALEDTTVDQYGFIQLTGSYRSQVVYANVDTRNLVLADLFFLAFSLVLYVHHETEGLGRHHNLLEVLVALDREQVVRRRNDTLLQWLFLDGFVVEHHLCQFVLVVRRFWHSPKFAWVFLPCV